MIRSGSLSSVELKTLSTLRYEKDLLLLRITKAEADTNELYTSALLYIESRIKEIERQQ